MFMAGSPFFLKNYAYARAFRHLRMPVCDLPAADSSALDCLCLLAAMFSIVLVLIHHIHLLMYVPTIAAIVVCAIISFTEPIGRTCRRHRMARGGGRTFHRRAILRHRPSAGDRVCRAFAQPDGRPVASEPASFGYIWYQPLSKEIWETWARLPHDLLGVPVCAPDLAAHAALAIFS